MVSLTEIQDLLIRINEDSSNTDLVGAAVLINFDGYVEHAGIFIRHNEEGTFFHFDGGKVVLEEIDSEELYCFKELIFLDPILVPSFLTQCELIVENAKPEFGYFYEGSLYDGDGNFKSEGSFPEYMTCVGFCLNVIKGFMSEEDFFVYEDWDEDSIEMSLSFVENFINKIKRNFPDVKLDDFRKNLRRIKPIEYIAGAYCKDLPVRKEFTDRIIPNIKKVIAEIAAA